MWRVHMMKYYSAIEKEVLSHAAVWMTLENIVLSKRSQKKKKKTVTYGVIPFLYVMTTIIKSIQT